MGGFQPFLGAPGSLKMVRNPFVADFSLFVPGSAAAACVRVGARAWAALWGEAGAAPPASSRPSTGHSSVQPIRRIDRINNVWSTSNKFLQFEGSYWNLLFQKGSNILPVLFLFVIFTLMELVCINRKILREFIFLNTNFFVLAYSVGIPVLSKRELLSIILPPEG